MTKILTYLIVNSLVILGLSWLLPNFIVSNWGASIVFIIILTLLNWTVLPVVKLLTLPINILTLGIFNGLIALLAINLTVWLVDGVDIIGDGWTQFFITLAISIALSISSGLIEQTLQDE